MFLQILLQLGIIVVSSLVIMVACDTFEKGSRTLGAHFPEGLRGATINAIGSSLPELFTTFFLLFVFHDKDGFSGGIATCAGSAVFNAVVIPAVCIMAVVFFGAYVNGKLERVKQIQVRRAGFLRDAFFFIVAELVLIYFLSGKVLFWWMGGALISVYFVYLGYLYWEYLSREHQEVAEEDDEEEEEESKPSSLKAFFTLDFHWFFFRYGKITKGRAWVLLIVGVIAIAIPCHFLAKASVDLAIVLNIPVFFTAVILAAAATSVPDTIISIKDARRGDYDDAVSNAFGSNIFDITICIGLPLFLYGLIYGDVSLAGAATEATTTAATAASGVQELQILLLLVTVLVLAIFLLGNGLGRFKSMLLFSIYGLFISYCVGRAYHWPWADSLSQWLVIPGLSS